METSRGPVTRSLSYYNECDHPVEDVVILGSILSRKSWSSSLHRHLPFNNRWKDRYFVIENGEVLSIISSGRRMNLSIGRMALCYHEYSPNGSNVLALTYYDGNDSHNILRNNSSKTSITTPAFVNTYKKELEIQLQFREPNDLIDCKQKLLSAISEQKKIADQATAIAIKCINVFLKKKLREEVRTHSFLFPIPIFILQLFLINVAMKIFS